MQKQNREEKRRKSECIRQLSEKCMSCTVVTEVKYKNQLDGCVGCPVRKELDVLLGPPDFSKYEYTYKDVIEAFESSKTQKEAMFKLADWNRSLEKTILKDITGWCCELKVQNQRKSNKPIHFSNKEVTEMIADYEVCGHGTPAIAKKFGVSSSTISRTLVDAGIQMRKRGIRYEKGDGKMVEVEKVEKVISKSDATELKNQIASLDDDVQQIQELVEKETKQVNEALKEIQKMHIEAQSKKTEQEMHDKNRMYLVNANNELRAQVLELQEENAALRKILKKTL